MKIVVLDGFSCNPGDLSWDSLKALGEVVIYDRTAPSATQERIADADIVLTNKVIINDELIACSPQLKYVGVLATGYNVVDTRAAAEHGVVVTNIPAYSTDSVAQMTFAHILNIYNRVDHYARQNRDGRWARSVDFCYSDMPHHELAGSTIGIVGYGTIGSRVGQIAHDMGMRVVALTSKAPTELPGFVESVSLTELLHRSDVVSLHCPLVEGSTRHLINIYTLGEMKPGAVLINTGRGPLVDEDAVADALDSGRLSAYAADVMSSEPPAEDNRLMRHPHAFITPHIAWATVEARQRLIHIATENVRAFIAGTPVNVVNANMMK